MKQSPVQQRIVDRMRNGARLKWNCISGKFELHDGQSLSTVQSRTIAALEAAGLLERECLGDVLLSPAARVAAVCKDVARAGLIFSAPREGMSISVISHPQRLLRLGVDASAPVRATTSLKDSLESSQLRSRLDTGEGV